MTPKSDDDDEDDDVSVLRELPPGADPTIDWGLTSHLDEHGQPRIVERWLVVQPELAGLRLDHFLKAQIARLSRTKIQQIIDAQLTRAAPCHGDVRPPSWAGEQGAVKASTTVVVGDRFVIRRPAPPEPPCPRTFGVLVDDPRLLVIDKPAGLPVHASAKFYFNTLTRVLGERYPDEPEMQICHRIDRETSGCLVVARDREAAAVLKHAFEHKLVTKTYLALVHGEPPWRDEVTLDIPLRLAQPGDPTRLPHVRMMAGPAKGSSQAITRVQLVEQRGRFALVRCTLVTGRQHQIRAHLAAAGYPIVGDKLYAHGDDAFIEFCDRGLTPALAARFILWRHALHASTVDIPHPAGGRVKAEAPLPADIASLA